MKPLGTAVVTQPLKRVTKTKSGLILESGLSDIEEKASNPVKWARVLAVGPDVPEHIVVGHLVYLPYGIGAMESVEVAGNIFTVIKHYNTLTVIHDGPIRDVGNYEED